MKIKMKKEMKLPQLIEWAWENDVRSRMFIGSGDGIVKFGIGGLVTELEYIDSDETFKVEVEEEITEGTEIPRLVEVHEYRNGALDTNLKRYFSIKEVLDKNKYCDTNILTLYMLNDDGTLTLLWKDGEMVE
ncbi:hypothetical protein PQ701_04285 [Staphylococcus coagulans]|uniref:hypothetical protein n=1 Tax=Staphylococcus coagulans TaxID=74706 RepID=UPI002927DD6E|nr:hypothetical protein [Staphylococcus coagulans]MDU9304440.1 hypothetical protein [Staphylococcus coagulans]